MTVWIEGPATMAGPENMRLFSTAENVLGFWKQNECVPLDPDQDRIARENATRYLCCKMPLPNGGGMERRHAFLVEVDQFYSSGEWKDE